MLYFKISFLIWILYLKIISLGLKNILCLTIEYDNYLTEPSGKNVRECMTILPSSKNRYSNTWAIVIEEISTSITCNI